MLKTLIIDSDPLHKESIVDMLAAYSDSIEVVGKACDVLTAVHLVHQHQPDLVFLETNMPTYSGFKLSEFFEETRFQLVYITDKNEDALKAFKRVALAYLVKPVQKDKLHQALQKLAISTDKDNNTNFPKIKGNKFAFPSKSGWFYLSLEEINVFESDGRYTAIHSINKETVMTTFSLKQCQELLEKTTFIRVHRSFMINLQYIRHYAKGKDSFVLMENDTRIDVGKNFKEDLNTIVSYFVK